jgi:hypothetical protein
MVQFDQSGRMIRSPRKEKKQPGVKTKKVVIHHHSYNYEWTFTAPGTNDSFICNAYTKKEAYQIFQDWMKSEDLNDPIEEFELKRKRIDKFK